MATKLWSSKNDQFSNMRYHRPRRIPIFPSINHPVATYRHWSSMGKMISKDGIDTDPWPRPISNMPKHIWTPSYYGYSIIKSILLVETNEMVRERNESDWMSRGKRGDIDWVHILIETLFVNKDETFRTRIKCFFVIYICIYLLCSFLTIARSVKDRESIAFLSSA